MKSSLSASSSSTLRLSSILTIFTLLFSAQWSMAQLYSNGINNISSNWVGVGKSSPGGSLHIKETAGSPGFTLPGQPASYTYIPLLRLEGTPAAGGPIPVGPAPTWDMRMDGSSGLTFSTNPSGTVTPVLTLYSSRTEFKNKLMLADNAEFNESITPDGTQGYHLSLGMREVSAGNWMGTGFTFHQSSSGDFHLVLNKTANMVIQGASALADLTKLTVNSYKATFNVHQEISTRPSATGNSNYADLQFTNTQSTNSDKRMFVIRSIGDQHSSAPNTLEFWDPNNDGNAWFSMPVRIGGGYSDIGVINNDYDLYVSKGIRTEKVSVKPYAQWPDYVFDSEYSLLSIVDLKNYIERNSHLPEVPSAEEIEREGVNLGEMDAILLKKIEELTLYIIDLEERLNNVEAK